MTSSKAPRFIVREVSKELRGNEFVPVDRPRFWIEDRWSKTPTHHNDFRCRADAEATAHALNEGNTD